ncbi:hypothetical protein L3X38_032284 [Prunus dulcis]|uniref:DUF4218 domain-containing protein n=1 Tax=Prunus dulcis TaxID=3755 RepID=A0AAD4YUU4_PRUDU|nr:hypothetical protein L3X38_032284 [Prunus dulcis]
MFQLRHDIVQVLCKFEMIFPPAFFTSMMHVMVHLPEEALLAGPVNYHWMYPIERLLGELKKSVRNRAKPEGSIIEAWVQYESLTFCGINDPRPPSSPFLVFLLPASLSAVTSALSLRRHLSHLSHLPAFTSAASLPSQSGRFFPILRRPISLSSGHHFRRLSEEEHLRAVSSAEDGEGHPGDQQSYQHRIRRAPSGCTYGGVG